jgi:hypothetical protein
MIKVYGTRICKNCKGICHKGSWRRKVGERKSYYCSDTCLRTSLNKSLQESCKESGLTKWYETEYTEREYQDMRDSFFEPVNVIAK